MISSQTQEVSAYVDGINLVQSRKLAHWGTRNVQGHTCSADGAAGPAVGDSSSYQEFTETNIFGTLLPLHVEYFNLNEQ